MKQSITRGVPEGMIKEVRADFISSAGFRKRLSEILLDKIKVSRNKSLQENMYSEANWAYHQSDLIGYERALNDVISLISEVIVEK